jgi:hypothetical protein
VKINRYQAPSATFSKEVGDEDHLKVFALTPADGQGGAFDSERTSVPLRSHAFIADAMIGSMIGVTA